MLFGFSLISTMSIPFVDLLNLVRLTRPFHSGMRHGFKNRANFILFSMSSVGFILGTIGWISMLCSVVIQIRKTCFGEIGAPLDEARYNEITGGLPLLFHLEQWSFFLQVG